LALDLNLEDIQSLQAKGTLTAWRDGLEIDGNLTGVVIQTCGVSLEPFEVSINELIHLRAVPLGSPNLPTLIDGEVEIDLDSEDPPEAFSSDGVDIGSLFCESLALSLDPFPRKPGTVFESPSSQIQLSPFSVLAGLAKSQSSGD
jgi:hypothetical protein